MYYSYHNDMVDPPVDKWIQAEVYWPKPFIDIS